MKGTIVIRGESAGVKEATKELFKEVEKDEKEKKQNQMAQI